MKKIALLAVTLVFTAIFTVSASAQAQPGTGKIGWIITGAFGDDKEGIRAFVNAEKALETEMKPLATELQNLRSRIQTLSTEIENLQKAPSAVGTSQTITTKSEEGQRLQREFEFKQKEAQAKYAKRRQDVIGPIESAIYKALDEYAKQKGYSVVLNVSAMIDENGSTPILVLDQTANITKDFITFYNARPATTATTAAPK